MPKFWKKSAAKMVEAYQWKGELEDAAPQWFHDALERCDLHIDDKTMTKNGAVLLIRTHGGWQSVYPKDMIVNELYSYELKAFEQTHKLVKG